MTPGFIIKLRRFLDLLFQSFASQDSYIFSYPIIKKYGKIVKLSIEYYQPRRMTKIRGFIYIEQLLKILSKKPITHMMRKTLQIPQSQSFPFQTRFSRLRSPALDSYVLAQFFVSMAKQHRFSKIIKRMERTIVYKFFQNVIPIDAPKDPVHSKDRVRGLDVTLRGRIPKEPVRARKTIQNKTIGRRSIRHVNKQTVFINKAEGMNPRLGTFSVWVRLMI